MKKLLLVFAMFVGTTFSASAQVQQGSILVDAYYGFTNIPGALYNSNWDFEAEYWGATEANTSGLGPIGIRAEYLATDKLGLGIDFALNTNSASFVGTDYVNGEEISFDTEGSSTKWGAMITLNYHAFTNEVIDFYIMGGAGYKNRTSTLTTTNPNYTDEQFNDQAIGLTPDTSIPLAARLGLGLRIFFTENIGANVGLGFGQGGILNAGLSFAF
jgi:opacity protein-like surface antigen